MIAALVKYRRYHDYHADVERKVARHYRGHELAALPLVRRIDHLPAVLEIMLMALLNPNAAAPNEVPGVIRALVEAGTSAENLESLLTYVGCQRGVDYADVAAALSKAGLGNAASAVMYGHRHNAKRPQFLKQ